SPVPPGGQLGRARRGRRVRPAAVKVSLTGAARPAGPCSPDAQEPGNACRYPSLPTTEEHPMSEDRVEVERNEIEEVLSVLEKLIASVSSPVVRACLEEARDGVAHLAGRDAVPTGYERAAV